MALGFKKAALGQQRIPSFKESQCIRHALTILLGQLLSQMLKHPTKFTENSGY